MGKPIITDRDDGPPIHPTVTDLDRRARLIERGIELARLMDERPR